jgi:hypothetical protein
LLSLPPSPSGRWLFDESRFSWQAVHHILVVRAINGKTSFEKVLIPR